MATTARIQQTRLDAKRAKARAEARTWLDVCRAVNVRDNYTCRSCGRRCVQTLTVQDDRLEHHHVIPKSKGGPDTTANVCILCLQCHDERHVKRTLHISGDANGELTIQHNAVLR